VSMNIVEKYKEVRQQTITFCSQLQTEDYAIQAAKFASPPKWHLAHTNWFFETFILIPHLDNYASFDSNFNFLFNSYYNNAGDRVLQANRGNMSRPSIKEIYSYRDYVDDHMHKLLNTISNKAIVDLVVLGLNHEQQHQELLITDVKYMLGHNPIFPVFNDQFNLINGKNNSKESIKISAGKYEIGYKGNDFCYDNELGVHTVFVDDFKINNYLVTNGEYLEFMTSGGYSDFNLWLDDGWSWVNTNHINSPLYWHNIKGEWHNYTLAGLEKVNKDAPVCHINFLQWKVYE